MASRPLVSVHSITDDSKLGTVPLPVVFSTPIRHDVVKFVVGQIAKNNRQPYGVSRRAGHKHSAESWGTGRAVSRIPRVSGGGTHASGSGAFGNMVRGGHMFAPNKVIRRWHVAVPRKIRRSAVVSALAATASAPLVSARGHRIESIAEVPLVVADGIEQIKKTKDAVALLKKIGAYDDYAKARDTVHIRAGKGKWRNRRYVTRKGPLIVYKEKNGAEKAFRNLPGVETASVSSLSVTQLAPGGHIGRFVIWSEGAFKELDAIYGTSANEACPKKAKFHLPRPLLSNADITSLVNRNEIQSVLRPKRRQLVRSIVSRNPLRNKLALRRLTPHAVTLAAAARRASKKATTQKSRVVRRAKYLKTLASNKAATKKQ